MLNEHLDRCERMCGQEKERCFIQNRNQVRCIADMVVNKAMGVREPIEIAGQQESIENMRLTLRRAANSLQSLMDWVRYLHVVQDLRELRYYDANGTNRRRDERFCVPAAYQKHVRMDIYHQSDVETVSVLDFSRHGMRFQGIMPISKGAFVDCRFSAASGLALESGFKLKVVHCQPLGDSLIVGAEITEVENEGIFQVYRKLYDFILGMASSGEDLIMDVPKDIL